MNYHTFDVSIITSGVPKQYQLFARSEIQGEAKACTTIDPKSSPLNKLLKTLNAQTISDDELKSLGIALYQCLFVDKINMLFNRAFGETLASDDIGLRLRLTIEATELNVLPWELLYSPDQHLFLAASVETPLSRYLSIPTPIRRIVAPELVRILAVIPVSSGLNTEPEKQILQAVAAKLKPKIKVDFLEGPATPEAIRTALRNHEYHIVHYAGHGIFEDEQGVLLLDYNTDSSERMTADRFAHYFLDYPSIRLVVLNACQGATRSAHQVLVGMAPQLVLRGVPAVIAMQDTIRDHDAVLFATEFYSELCHERQGGQVEAAVSRARKALLQSGSQINGFALPVLYLRAPDGKLWDVEGTALIEETKEETKRKSLFERWQTWVAFISTVVVLLGALTNLPKQFKDAYQTIVGVEKQCQFYGKVIDENKNPVAGAEIILPGYKGKGKTDSTGRFDFKVDEEKGNVVQVIVKKNNIEGYSGTETLPGPVTLTFRRRTP